MLGGDVVQHALVMRDEQNPEVRPNELVHAHRHRFQGVDVETGVRLVQDCDLGLEDGELQDLVLLLLPA